MHMRCFMRVLSKILIPSWNIYERVPPSSEHWNLHVKSIHSSTGEHFTNETEPGYNSQTSSFLPHTTLVPICTHAWEPSWKLSADCVSTFPVATLCRYNVACFPFHKHAKKLLSCVKETSRSSVPPAHRCHVLLKPRPYPSLLGIDYKCANMHEWLFTVPSNNERNLSGCDASGNVSRHKNFTKYVT